MQQSLYNFLSGKVVPALVEKMSSRVSAYLWIQVDGSDDSGDMLTVQARDGRYDASFSLGIRAPYSSSSLSELGELVTSMLVEKFAFKRAVSVRLVSSKTCCICPGVPDLVGDSISGQLRSPELSIAEMNGERK